MIIRLVDNNDGGWMVCEVVTMNKTHYFVATPFQGVMSAHFIGGMIWHILGRR